jgi:hypothetical protein
MFDRPVGKLSSAGEPGLHDREPCVGAAAYVTRITWLLLPRWRCCPVAVLTNPVRKA